MSEQQQRQNHGWVLMSAVLTIEVLGAIWVLWLAFREALKDTNDPLGQTISIILMALAMMLWIAATLGGAVRKRQWSRASNLSLQVLVLAAGVGVLQGIMGTVAIGLGLIALAILGISASIMLRPKPKGQPESENVS